MRMGKGVDTGQGTGTGLRTIKQILAACKANEITAGQKD